MRVGISAREGACLSAQLQSPISTARGCVPIHMYIRCPPLTSTTFPCACRTQHARTRTHTHAYRRARAKSRAGYGGHSSAHACHQKMPLKDAIKRWPEQWGPMCNKKTRGRLPASYFRLARAHHTQAPPCAVRQSCGARLTRSQHPPFPPRLHQLCPSFYHAVKVMSSPHMRQRTACLPPLHPAFPNAPWLHLPPRARAAPPAGHAASQPLAASRIPTGAHPAGALHRQCTHVLHGAVCMCVCVRVCVRVRVCVCVNYVNSTLEQGHALQGPTTGRACAHTRQLKRMLARAHACADLGVHACMPKRQRAHTLPEEKHSM